MSKGLPVPPGRPFLLLYASHQFAIIFSVIKENTIIIRLNQFNVGHYASKGYQITRTSKFKNSKYGFSNGDTLEVLVSDLPKDSRVKITHVCEDCGIERLYSYRDALPLKLCKRCVSSGVRNGMKGKRIVRKSERLNGIAVLPMFSFEEKRLLKLKRSVLYASYRKVYDVLKGKRNKSNIIKYLGCSVEEFKIHIQSLFQPGMTWENWSKTGWHLDHVIPLEKLDPENEDDFKKSCHYNNFQPMWASNNCSKGSSLPLVYVLTGCFASGKSWISNQLHHKFHIVDYDTNKKFNFTNPPDFKKPVLYELPMKVSTFLNENQETLNLKLVVITHDYETIINNLQSRGGTINKNSIKNRITRMKTLAKSSIFSGTSNEVLNFLLSINT